ncbi:MAG: mucoidy inhibitor MuiA family protein, partial [Planctomycetia bacterium]|nr:mucoidy inhibitor MuiA family protein [Planctomycetia bacterium]
MRRIYVLLLVGFAACAWGARADAKDNAIEASGAIETVTVYRGQALVARLIEVDAPRGSLELVVTDLPTHILPGSLYASGEGEVQIRAVRYRSRSVKEEPREEIRKIDKQIEDIDRRLRENQAMQTLQAQHQDYLTKLEGFTAATAKVEMSKGVLNADTIKSLTEFLANRREGLVKRTLELGEAARALKKEKSHLLSKRHEITTKSTRTAREAIVFLEKPDGGRLKVRLNYLVRQAGWSPMYNLRCKGDRKKVDLEYIALVRQMSGEDWKGVGLTLSTASPAMVAEAPIITPFWVTLGTRPQSTLRGAAEVYQKQKAAGGRLRGAWQQRKQVLSQKDALKQDWDLNRPANDLQMLDFAARREILLAARVRPTEEALSVNYVLPGKISIPSRSDQQMIQIASLVLPAKFYYLAAPVLTPYVYQQADVVNSSEVAFLSGPLNS